MPAAVGAEVGAALLSALLALPETLPPLCSSGERGAKPASHKVSVLWAGLPGTKGGAMWLMEEFVVSRLRLSPVTMEGCTAAADPEPLHL